MLEVREQLKLCQEEADQGEGEHAYDTIDPDADIIVEKTKEWREYCGDDHCDEVCLTEAMILVELLGTDVNYLHREDDDDGGLAEVNEPKYVQLLGAERVPKR